jgi:hypothetical protein
VSLSLPELRSRAKRWFPGRTRTRHRIRVGLAPERIVLASYGGGRRPTLARAEAIFVEPRAEAARWQAAVDALPSALAQLDGGGCPVTVILSSQLVRYAVLPWNAALKSEDDWLAYARHRLQSVHGAAAGEWDFRICATAPHGPRLVSATDRALLEALDAAVATAGGTLESVQPYLMAAFNQAAPLPGDSSFWLVIEEPGRLTLALVQDGTWRSVRSRRVDARWREELPAILERESAALGLEQPCTEVALHAEAIPEVGAAGQLQLRDLVAGAGEDRRTLAMVLQ